MEVYVHLGIHKTGSSFLQKEFFPQYKEETLFLSRSDIADFKRYILYTDDFEFDQQEGLRIFKTIVNKANSCNRVVISDEEFYGNPFIGVLDRKRNIDRLILVFGGSLNILIFLRSQQLLLNSLYNQYIKTGGTASFKNFIEHKKYPLNFQVDYLKYDKYLSYIESEIGKSRMKVFLYEDFLLNKTKILSQINQFITKKNELDISVSNPDKKVNSSLNNGNIPLMRFLNKFTKSQKEPFLLFNIIFHKLIKKIILKLGFSLFRNKKYFLTNDVHIIEIQESNSRLKKHFEMLDIEKHNYLINN